MAFFDKYILNKKYVMEDWEAADEIEPHVQKLANGTASLETKELIHNLLQKVLIKKVWFGKDRPATKEEIEKLTLLDKHKYTALFFSAYMKKIITIRKIWKNSANVLSKPLKK